MPGSYDLLEAHAYIKGDMIGPLGKGATELLELAVGKDEWLSPEDFTKLLEQATPNVIATKRQRMPKLDPILAAAMRTLGERHRENHANA